MKLQDMMKQAQEMQGKMQEMQNNLDHVVVEGQAGGGLVTVTMSGKFEIKAIKIDPSIVDRNDIDTLEDLITAAVNDARNKAEDEINKQTGDIMGQFNLPPGVLG